MKKLIIPIIFLLLVGLVLAGPPMPAPVKGQVFVEGSPADGYYVEVTNDFTKEVLTYKEVSTLKIENGIYFFDMSSFKEGYETTSARTKGDTIIVTFGNKNITFTADSFPYVVPNMNVGKEDLPVVIPPVEPPVTVKILCSDGVTYVDKVEDCPAVEPPKEDLTMEISLALLATLLGLGCIILGKFKWGKGFVGLANYYKKLGDEARSRKDYAQAKKYYERAAKMVSTAVKKAKDGSYK